jgi:hypothetical protein
MTRANWDSLLLHQKIAIKGPILTKHYGDYLNKIKVKSSVPMIVPEVRIAKLVRTFNDPNDFTKEDMNPNHILKASRGSGLLVDLATIRTPEEAHAHMKYWIQKLNRVKKPVEFLIEEKITDAVFGKIGNAADYKFFCFHGQPAFFLCRFNRNRNFYDLDYNPLKLQRQSELPRIDIKPMIEIAKKLSAPFEFVRIDLYNGVDGVYFGEYTFHVNAGIREFDEATELRLGKLWTQTN